MDYTYYCFGLPGMPTAVYAAGAEHKGNIAAELVTSAHLLSKEISLVFHFYWFS